jgi:hypothetical protein
VAVVLSYEFVVEASRPSSGNIRTAAHPVEGLMSLAEQNKFLLPELNNMSFYWTMDTG